METPVVEVVPGRFAGWSSPSGKVPLPEFLCRLVSPLSRSLLTPLLYDSKAHVCGSVSDSAHHVVGIKLWSNKKSGGLRALRSCVVL